MALVPFYREKTGPGQNGASTQATGHVTETDDRRGRGQRHKDPTSHPSSRGCGAMSPQPEPPVGGRRGWADSPNQNSPRPGPVSPAQTRMASQWSAPSDQGSLPGPGRPPQTRMAPGARAAPSPGLADNQLQQGGSWTFVPGCLPGAVRPPPPRPLRHRPPGPGSGSRPPELADHPQLTDWARGAELRPLPRVVPPPQGSPTPCHRGGLLHLLPACSGTT